MLAVRTSQETIDNLVIAVSNQSGHTAVLERYCNLLLGIPGVVDSYKFDPILTSQTYSNGQTYLSRMRSWVLDGSGHFLHVSPPLIGCYKKNICEISRAPQIPKYVPIPRSKVCSLISFWFLASSSSSCLTNKASLGVAGF